MTKVVLIEDDVDLQNLYKEKLVSEGFEFYGAFSGEDGWQLIKEKKPNIIMLDIMLAGKLNGFDVLEKIRVDDDFKKTPVLIITSLDSQEESAFQVGASDIVVKSNATPDDIVNKLRGLLK